MSLPSCDASLTRANPLVIEQYYTATLRYDSIAHWSQRQSRRERFGPLLAQIGGSARFWPLEESNQYQTAIWRAASELCGSSDDDNDLPLFTSYELERGFPRNRQSR